MPRPGGKRTPAKKSRPKLSQSTGPGIRAADHAPSVTVFTNIAGAVAVTVDRETSNSAGHRLASKPLPENFFNPFRECRSKRRSLPKQAKQDVGGVSASGVDGQNPHVVSAAAAAVAVEGIKKGVRDALDRWALQT